VGVLHERDPHHLINHLRANAVDLAADGDGRLPVDDRLLDQGDNPLRLLARDSDLSAILVANEECGRLRIGKPIVVPVAATELVATLPDADADHALRELNDRAV
jgi:hypothetical protein